MTIIGLGTTGAKIIDGLASQENKSHTFWIMDSDEKTLGNSHLYNRFLLSMRNMGHLVATLHDTGTDGNPPIVLLSALGGFTSRNWLPIVCDYLVQTPTDLAAVISIPPRIEGRRARRLAEETFDLIRPSLTTIAILSLDMLFQLEDTHATVQDVYVDADRLCVYALSLIAGERKMSFSGLGYYTHSIFFKDSLVEAISVIRGKRT